MLGGQDQGASVQAPAAGELKHLLKSLQHPKPRNTPADSMAGLSFVPPR